MRINSVDPTGIALALGVAVTCCSLAPAQGGAGSVISVASVATNGVQTVLWESGSVLGLGVLFIPPVYPSSAAFNNNVVLAPGDNEISMFLVSYGSKGTSGSAGGMSKVGVALHFPSSPPALYWAPTPQSLSQVTGVSAPLPLGVPGDSLALPLQTAQSGVAGLCWSDNELGITQQGSVISINARSTSCATVPWNSSVPVSAVGALMVTIRFSVAQATPVTILGTLSNGFQGHSQEFPILPNSPGAFVGCESGLWVDPPLAIGYDFVQNGASLFTDVLELPSGIDGDGMFEVQVGNQSLGQFAAGARVDFRALLGGNGVPSFRITGIAPGSDVSDPRAFPVKLAFDTPVADFSMTPVLWRSLGTACSDLVCAPCASVALAPVGAAIAGNQGFGFSLQNGPSGGLVGMFAGIGPALTSPVPIVCGLVYIPPPWVDIGIATLAGATACDGAASVALPLPSGPGVFGTFLTVQAATLCSQGGIGLSPAIEFAVGN